MAIVVTGAAGFIGSCLASFLNKKGFTDIILVDDFGREDKGPNWERLHFSEKLDRSDFLQAMDPSQVDFVFHLGARTDTTLMDVEVFDRLNLNYSKRIWRWCSQHKIPLLYASSAATYGDGSLGFDDSDELTASLKPLNPYGQSKLDFDLWALEQKITPPFWCGLRFFNVFGPNEYHKGRMASVVLHAYKQIVETGGMKLFSSHHPDYKDGEQRRDFIYIADLLELMWFWYQHQKDSGIYNAGTGEARTFLDLAKAIFKSLDMEERIEFIPTPEDIRERYQYYTCAEMGKSRNVGFEHSFQRLEAAVNDYVQHYLKDHSYL